MREIILDTETTGLDPDAGHRVVEIACLEVVNLVPTGRHYQTYLNPDRDMPEEARAVHGLTSDFLADKPRFTEVVEDFLNFIAEDPLIIHNAPFDLKFLNAELASLERPPILPERAVDTVRLARSRFPGAQANLDALCRRFEIDNSARTFHGALLDCELLAEVYLELRGGRQPGFALDGRKAEAAPGRAETRQQRPARPHAPSPEEERAHVTMLESIDNPIWRR
jgi:DNA polymerase-3 subunit epsilon